ncbi:MAG TPA: hypothetical protein VM597_34225 [Gemmataceae bacterium]|jgi:hypothetical protein|nr:hypothetical protein [Gemmataceae bacterium]
MPFRSHSQPPVGRWAVLVTFCLAGCGPSEQVSKYTAPKDPVDPDLVSDAPTQGEPEVRVLGAIAEAGKPGEESWYFFKFQGPKLGDSYPPRAIERHAADFDAFVKSLKFPAAGAPTWTVPAGWRAVEVQTQFPRIATFRMRKSETTVDLAVSQTGGDLLGNINRWYGQAGAEPIKADEIATKTRVLTVDGRKVWVVDVSGPGPKGGGMVPPFAK